MRDHLQQHTSLSLKFSTGCFPSELQPWRPRTAQLRLTCYFFERKTLVGRGKVHLAESGPVEVFWPKAGGWRQLRGEAVFACTFAVAILRGARKCLVIEPQSQFSVAHLYHQLYVGHWNFADQLEPPESHAPVSLSLFPLKTTLSFHCPSISLPPPCLPGLVCHCGLIISACSLYFFQPANLPPFVTVTAATESFRGLFTGPPPGLEATQKVCLSIMKGHKKLNKW